MKKVICNLGCDKEFIVVQAGVIRIIDDIEDVGFNCPHCDKRYTLHYTNDHIKKLQAEQQALLKQSDPRKLSERQLQGIMQLINSKKRKISAAMKELRKQVEQG